jgi:hypothetical protein
MSPVAPFLPSAAAGSNDMPPEITNKGNQGFSGLDDVSRVNNLTSDNNKMDVDGEENSLINKIKSDISPRRCSPLRRHTPGSPQRKLPQQDLKLQNSTSNNSSPLSPKKNSLLHQAASMISPRKSPRPERKLNLDDSKSTGDGVTTANDEDVTAISASESQDDAIIEDTSDKTKKRAIKGVEDEGSTSSASDPFPKRKKRTKSTTKESNTSSRSNSNSKAHEGDREDSDQEADDKSSISGDSKSSKDNTGLLDHIPQDIRFDPKSLENKPKGLVDALSNFFTPGLKRTSRTAMNSLLKPEAKSELSDKDPSKKVRLSVDEKELANREQDSVASERKRHASAGQQQVKSLYDGLSHLYNDCDSRLRSVPMTNYSEKGSSAGGSVTATAGGSGEAGKAGASPERIASPQRMSDSELKERVEASHSSLKKLKDKGNSKDINIVSMRVFCIIVHTL